MFVMKNIFCLACASPSLWQDLASKLKLNVEELISDNKKEITRILVANKNEKVCVNIIESF